MAEKKIPFVRMGIPKEMRPNLGRDAPTGVKLALARGLVPTTADVQLSICYILASTGSEEVKAAANDTMANMAVDRIVNAIHIRTHPKVLEYLVEVRREPKLDDKVGMHKLANDRTVRLIARRADKTLCEKLSLNHERLVMTPDVFIDLHANPKCQEKDLRQAENFLRMQRMLPNVPEVRPFLMTEEQKAAAAPKPAKSEMDLEAEILAAIAGEQSPALLAAQETGLDMFDVGDQAPEGGLGGFDFSFDDETEELSFILTQEREPGEHASLDEVRSMEGIIRDMSPGQKIKLAYLGNQESRKILIRDSNKLVAAAVVKSGRLSDGEALQAAGNRNLADDVIREIATNREWVRKYPFQVALVNNPKCPVAASMGFIRTLNRQDLQSLTRNRNIPGAVNQAAIRLYRQKFKIG